MLKIAESTLGADVHAVGSARCLILSHMDDIRGSARLDTKARWIDLTLFKAIAQKVLTFSASDRLSATATTPCDVAASAPCANKASRGNLWIASTCDAATGATGDPGDSARFAVDSSRTRNPSTSGCPP